MMYLEIIIFKNDLYPCGPHLCLALQILANHSHPILDKLRNDKSSTDGGLRSGRNRLQMVPFDLTHGQKINPATKHIRYHKRQIKETVK